MKVDSFLMRLVNSRCELADRIETIGKATLKPKNRRNQQEVLMEVILYISLTRIYKDDSKFIEYLISKLSPFQFGVFEYWQIGFLEYRKKRS
ncbi:MAG: hypothetical protein FJX71_02495 [Alphaproteobacteria bacterium]|nr:hypothetical protein [Alphaproteobacteria bacterium]